MYFRKFLCLCNSVSYRTAVPIPFFAPPSLRPQETVAHRSWLPIASRHTFCWEVISPLKSLRTSAASQLSHYEPCQTNSRLQDGIFFLENGNSLKPSVPIWAKTPKLAASGKELGKTNIEDNSGSNHADNGLLRKQKSSPQQSRRRMSNSANSMEPMISEQVRYLLDNKCCA